MRPTLQAIYRYPVKGLSPEALETIALSAGMPVPFDRAYAIENGPGAFDAAAPRHLPKVTYLCLMRDAGLAALTSVFDPATTTLRLSRAGVDLATGDLSSVEGRAAIEAAIAREMATSLRGPPRIVSAPAHSFSDVAEKCVHIVNAASVAAFGRVVGAPFDPLRCRPNVIVDGLDAMAELDFVGRTITLGSARLHVFKRTKRCAAINVDPATAQRHGDLPQVLFDTYGHRDIGIYATVVADGTISVGDSLSVV